MTAIPCPHCELTCAGPAGLASHIRSMHPEEWRASRVHEAPPGPATPESNGLVWEEPPPKSRGNARAHEILALIPELRRHPKRWARLYTFSNKTGANATHTALRKHDDLEDIEFIARSDTKAGTSALYARYTGE